MAPLGPLRALNSPRPRPAQPHWDRSHLCTPRPSHLCRPRPRGPASPPRPSPAPLPPIKAGQSAPVPFSSGDALLRMLRERRSERCEEIRIGGWCCMEPEVLRWKEPLRHGCSDRAWYCSSGCGQCGTGVLPGPDDRGENRTRTRPASLQPGAALNRHTEMPQPGQTPPTAQKDPKEQLALPGMEAQTVCRGAQTAVPVSDLPELPGIESQAVYFGDASKSDVQLG
ncbi:uncharacterized protein LOC141727048 isoform X4 [Zonotrichia albicollis]|uniref:uncharacterized protein LOC141727048 isoform X4 n=1 Tax=Zonotrichia albicollis TaxID=44394 RepID=UPI003D811A65